MPDLTVVDVRPFVPTLDLRTSQAFYQALGWTQVWSDGGLALMRLGRSQIVLQDHYVKEWAENSMLTVEVASVDDWHAHVADVLAARAYGGARLSEPRDDGWARVAHVWDPCGVLLHYAQFSRQA